MKTRLTSAAITVLTVLSITTSLAQQGKDCGCPPFASRPTVLLSSLAFNLPGDNNDGDLAFFNTILNCSFTYILDKKIYVPDGYTLTIMPGTVIKGRATTANNATFLIVEAGGMISANATESCPIIFTAEADPLDGTYAVANRGKWGGLIILGKAFNNLKAFNANAINDGVGYVNGLNKNDSRNWFGPAFWPLNDNDNSGVLNYVSIRHAGQRINNTLRGGLYLGSVGNATTLKHVEVVSSDGDGFEILGGSVDLKFAAALFCDNNMFKGDLGWSGKGQFWFGLKTDPTSTSIGEGGIRLEGDDDKSEAFPVTHPVIYNVTFIGNGSNTIGAGFQAKEHTEGELYNGIFANFNSGVEFSKGTRPNGDAYDNWMGGTVAIKNSTFVNNVNLFTINGNTAAILSGDNSKFNTDGNLSAPNAIDYTFTMNTGNNTITNKINPIPNATLTTTITPPANGFFSPASYRGAFGNNQKSWLASWSYASIIQIAPNLNNCPTDVNLDGNTTNADFLMLLSQFNQVCR